MNKLHITCNRCQKEATYNVWYRGYGNAYGYMCPEHAAEEILKWAETASPVSVIKPMAESEASPILVTEGPSAGAYR